MVKVLLINAFYAPTKYGGAGISVQILAETLRKQGIEPVVLCSSDEDRVDIVNGVKVYYVKIPNLYWAYDAKRAAKWLRPLWHFIDAYNIFAAKKILRIMREQKPDLVHSHALLGISTVVWSCAKKLSIPVVHTLREYYLLCWRSSMFKKNMNCEEQCFFCKSFTFFRKRSSRYVDAVTGVSNFTLRRHLKAGYFRKAKIKRCVYNAADIAGVEAKKKAPGKIVFGYVGRLSRAKGVELLLDVFKEQFPGLPLKIYGKADDKAYEKYLKEKYASPCISFEGFAPREAIYENINVLVLPALWHEPFGRVIIEAFAHGVVVIITMNVGSAEIIKDGINGFVFDSKEKGALERTVKKALDDPKGLLSMSENCRMMAKLYSPDEKTKEYAAVYREVLNKL